MEKKTELKFRNLTEKDIECRIGNIAKESGGFSLLLYKTARVDANILDDTVGAFNWTKRFYQVKNTMICSIGIRNEETNEWVFKDDAGDDDFQAEKVKGEASDSFKRAGFAWGIGRELYNAPKIWIPITDKNTTKSYYSVSKIEFDENKQIINLEIVNDKTHDVVFSFKNGKKVSLTSEKAKLDGRPLPNEERGSIAEEDVDFIQLCLSKYGESSRQRFFHWLDSNFGTLNIEALTYSQGKKVVNELSGRK